mgnify:CR=1 FL=1
MVMSITGDAFPDTEGWVKNLVPGCEAFTRHKSAELGLATEWHRGRVSPRVLVADPPFRGKHGMANHIAVLALDEFGLPFGPFSGEPQRLEQVL